MDVSFHFSWTDIGVKFLAHVVTLCLPFWGAARLFSTWTAPFYTPTRSVWGFHFLLVLVYNCIIYLSNYSHPSGREAESHCGFDLRFPDGWSCWASFYVLFSYLCIFLGQMSISALFPFSNWVIHPFIIEL